VWSKERAVSKGGGWMLVGLAVLVASAASGRAGDAQWTSRRVSVGFPDGTTVRAELADTPAVRQRGLMFRRSLGPNEGMLFVFEQPGSYPFWMQNCLFPIDIIWLDADARVVSIAHAVPPCRLPGCDPPCGSFDCPTYPHDGQALYVVEVVAGFAKQHGVKVGDRVTIEGLGR
jgi:uncharacterized membrane protein (UPF0127 family)